MNACPECGSVLPLAEMLDEEAEIQVHALELRVRSLQSKVTRMEREREAQTVAKRDGAVWQRVITAWLEAFPDKTPSAKSVKSARATKVFMRLDSGATVDDVLAAIRGAQLYPFVVFGKRVKSGSRSDLADDLEDIVAVNRDREFDFLVEAGRNADR